MSLEVQSLTDVDKTIDQLLKNSGGISAAEFGKFCRRIASLVPQGTMLRGLVGNLAVLWACVRFGLSAMPEGQPGFDVVDPSGHKRLGPVNNRYQVKGRSPEKTTRVRETGTTGRFTNMNFNAALLVLLDKYLQNYEIWLVDPGSLQKSLRPGRRDISVRMFKKIGRSVYP